MKVNRTVMKLFFAAIMIFLLATMSLYFMLHITTFQSDSPKHFHHNNRSFEATARYMPTINRSGLNISTRTHQKGFLVTDVRGVTLRTDSGSLWVPFGKVIPGMMKEGHILLFDYSLSTPVGSEIVTKLIPVALSSPPAKATFNLELQNKCNQSNIIAGIDYTGGDINGIENPAHTTSALDCCDTCRMTPTCSHFTFLPHSNECWLKQTIPASRLIQSHFAVKAISGVIPVENRATTGESQQSKLTVDNRNNLPECCESSPLHLYRSNNALSLVSEVGSLLPSSPYHLRVASVSGEWQEQFLVGNGLFGAIVGGNIRREIIPLSIRDFFAYKPDYNNGNQQQQKNKNKGDVLTRARQQLLNGQFQQAQSTMQTMQSGGLGMFEYLADLFLFFGSTSWIFKESEDINNQLPPRVGKGRIPLRAKMPLEAFQGRERLRRMIMSHIQPSSSTPSITKKTVLMSAGILDMRAGIATQQFIEKKENEGGEDIDAMIDSHDREWFASSTDDLLIGSYICHTSPYEADDLDNMKQRSASCLHVAVGWQRDTSSGRGSPNVNYQRKFNQQTKLHELDMSIKSSKELLVPSVHVCAAIHCIGGTTLTNSPLKDQLLLCNNADRLEIFISVISIDSLGKLPEEYDSSPSTMQRLKDDCWKKVNAGVKKGYSQLRDDHMASFSKAMSRTELLLLTSNSSQTCPNDLSADRLHGFGQGCRNSSDESNPQQQEIEDIAIISQLYQMGRYLLLSSGQRSVMNLQGLWADGVRAEWNGDYHMNINIQMMYFAAAGAGVGETLLPLLDWAEKLAITGRQTAAGLLQPPPDNSWVAHGFTDSTLRAMPLADLQWSLCITCGAWIATTLFDIISYGHFPHDEAIIKRILLIFRGVAEFFEAYLLRVEDETTGEIVLLTGPTTSPENSFRYRYGNNSGLSFMAMSPAIDVSILREFANVYLIITAWYSELSKNAFDYHKQAIQFQKLIQQMPNHGMPKIDPNTKRIVEYPFSPRQVHIDEDLDRGHRHFSLLHWLYPGQFLPRHQFELYKAAQESLLTKRRHAGGHTGWSAVWEATLWARLREGDEAFTSISHVVSKYITTNLLGLHPPLDKQPLEECETCFAEPSILKTVMMQKRLAVASNTDTSTVQEEFINRERGLKTTTNNKFQLDANLGYLAAIHEMLFQSHIPQTLALLPALPRSWREGGQLRGIRGRGDVEISFRWTNGLIETWEVILHSPHPWWKSSSSTAANGDNEDGQGMMSEKKDYPGFMSVNQTAVEENFLKISMLAPNALSVSSNVKTDSDFSSLLLPVCQVEKVAIDKKCLSCRMLSHQQKMVKMSIVLKPQQITVKHAVFPCILHGCGSHVSKCKE